MENAASIRSQSVVAAFDPTDHVAEHGFVVANPEALEAARGLCKDITASAIEAIDQHFINMKAIGQNPYRERCHMQNHELRFVALVEISESGAMAQRFETAFGESPGLPRPKLPIFMSKVEGEIRKALAAHGFELAACEHHDDGTLARVAVRDPVYAAEAAKIRGTASSTQDLEEGLKRLRNSTSAAAKADLGIQQLRSPDKLQDVLAFVDEIVVRAVETTRTHLQAMVGIEQSPFTTDSQWFSPWSCFVVDKYRVHRCDGEVSTTKSASVVIEPYDVIMERFDRSFRGDVSVRDESFLQYVRVAVGQRLKQHPELRAALVASSSGSINGAKKESLTVFCVDGPSSASTTTRERPPWRRLLDLLMMRTPKPELPAPTPQALPAPEGPALGEPIPPIELSQPR